MSTEAKKTFDKNIQRARYFVDLAIWVHGRARRAPTKLMHDRIAQKIDGVDFAYTLEVGFVGPMSAPLVD